jgi:hypothetical protein
VANDSMPRSLPVSCPVGGKGCMSASAQENHPYCPSASWLIVTIVGVPCKGLMPFCVKGKNLRGFQGSCGVTQSTVY